MVRKHAMKITTILLSSPTPAATTTKGIYEIGGMFLRNCIQGSTNRQMVLYHPRIKATGIAQTKAKLNPTMIRLKLAKKCFDNCPVEAEENRADITEYGEAKTIPPLSDIEIICHTKTAMAKDNIDHAQFGTFDIISDHVPFFTNIY